MKLIKGLVLVTTLCLVGIPAFAADDLDEEMNSDRELAHALAILDTIISEGQGDAAAHELLGDVYALKGLKSKAQSEYAVAESLKQAQETPLLSHK